MLIEDLIVSEDMSVIDAMKKLNETGKKILFIAPDMKLQAVITDSDIRRHILHGANWKLRFLKWLTTTLFT